MRMEHRQFRIGQLARELDVERFVIRFWEKEFNINSTRSEGGQRFYTEDDLKLFQKIKVLLYEEGFTISGAKKFLNEEKKGMAAHKTTMDVTEKIEKMAPLAEKILLLQKQLIKLRELL